MTIPIWPSSVPFLCALRNLSGSGPENDVSVFMPDAGMGRARRITTAPIRAVSGATPALTATQFAAFEDFWDTDLESGVLPFYAIHPGRGVAVPFRRSDARPYGEQPVGAGLTKVTLSLVWRHLTASEQTDYDARA